MDEATAEADRLIACCTETSRFRSDQSPATVRRALWAAIHGVAVVRITKQLPANVDPDRLAADILDVTLGGFFQM